MRFQSAVRYILTKHKYSLDKGKTPEPILLLGPPGIGKTAIARMVAEAMRSGGTFNGKYFSGYVADPICEVVDLTSRLPEDLGGLPTIEDGVTSHAPFDYFKRLCEPGAVGVLCLDDIPAASPSVATAARQIILDRSINGHTLAPGIIIIGTGNRAEDGASASTLPSHFRNAVCIVEVEPDFESWQNWYGQNMVGPAVVAAFLKHKPDLFSKHPDDADRKGSYPTPRTWAKMASELEPAMDAGCLTTHVNGWVGEGPGAQFAGYCDLFGNLPSAADMLDDPEKAVPNPADLMKKADRRIGAMVSIGFEASTRQRVAAQNMPRPKAAQVAIGEARKLFTAIRWLCGNNYEYAEMARTAYANAGGSESAAGKALGQLITSDKAAKDFYGKLAKAYKV